MSDTDIDPALEAHLRRCLRQVAATVADEDQDRVVRLVTRPIAAERGARRWTWLAAAAIAGVVTGVGLTTLTADGRDRSQSVTGSTEAVPVPGAVDIGALAEACRSGVESLQDQIGPGFGEQPPPPDPAQASVLLFDTAAVPAHHVVLVVGDSTFYHCNVTDPDSGRLGEIDGNVIDLPAIPPPTEGDVQVLDQAWYTGATDAGPGWVYAIGRAGPDVATIELELPDGSTISGELSDGWFVVEGPIPAGVVAFEERINWTTTGGQQRTSRADLLDPPDQTEACAANPDCVLTTLSALRREAEVYGLDSQATILEDLDVTASERRAAREAFASCVNASDYDITVTVTDEFMSFSGSDLDAASPDWEAQNNVQMLCSAAHLDLVDEAWRLLDAQRRVEEL